MTKQKTIGAIIAISLPVIGLIFKLYNPIFLAIWLLVVVIAILGEIGEDRLAKFWRFPSKQTQNKYPTIEDIRRKYPKRLTQEQLRRQARAKDESEAKRKKEIIDRHIKESRASNNLGKNKNYDQGHGVRRESIRDISIAKFRQLARMVNGQDDVARRLIEGNLKLNPDKSPDWACEKAIADIERDRRVN